eukprot:7161043-Lingulodinium_polyedra.AAC.1
MPTQRPESNAATALPPRPLTAARAGPFPPAPPPRRTAGPNAKNRNEGAWTAGPTERKTGPG